MVEYVEGERRVEPNHFRLIQEQGGNRVLFCKPLLDEGKLKDPIWRANELIAHRIAQELGMPVLPASIVTFDGDMLFGTEYRPEATRLDKYEEAGRDISLRGGIEVLSRLLPFDLFVFNCDRTPSSILLDSGEIWATDHEKSVFGDGCGGDLRRFSSQGRIEEFHRCISSYQKYLAGQRPFWSNRDLLAGTCSCVEGLGRETMLSVVSDVPREWWQTRMGGEELVDFLFESKTEVRAFLESCGLL